MEKNKFNVEWELFMDSSNYDMWAVRPKNDKEFNSPRLFHFIEKRDAEAFKALIEKSYCAVPNKKTKQ